jgi:hypothetical protein
VIGHPAIFVLVCLTVAYGLAVAIYPLVRRRGALSVVVAAAACIACWASLFIIPPEHVILRALTSLLNVDLFFRLIDFTRQTRLGKLENVGWADYCRFLIPFPLLLVVFGEKGRRLRPDQRSAADVWRLVLSASGIALGFMLLFAANRAPALRASFLLDHVTKLFIFLLTVESMATALCCLERLAGYDTSPLVDRTFLARTPAEFWRRWNNRINAWLYWNAFVPAGGRSAPIRGVWAACLASAVLHEVAFTIATSQFTGYQFIFFAIQAPAIIFSRTLERLARELGTAGVVIARATTVLWMAVTSMFFLHGADLVFTFYYQSQPWLP